MHFNSIVCAKKRKLRNDLRNIFQKNSSIFYYLFCIQTIIDSLLSTREHVSRYHHVDIILDGLPDEFESLVPFVSGKFESLSIDEVMTLLLAHETQIAHKKSHASSVTSINLTEEAKPNLVHQDSHTQAYVAQGFGSSSHFGSSTYL